MTAENPAAEFAQALIKLAEYETDPEGTPSMRLTVKATGTGEEREVLIEPGQLGWVTDLIRDELDSFRNAHSDGTGRCGHCRGTGLSGGTGGAADLEPPADDGSRP
ncbi:hypothetical protein ABZY68_25335 [Streptomyces sp. NPDC006482]|uniref:hypothetical protein n=1 Tax=Streptomyces sp. NPDC006482 TaxID=3154306 RepID=UPI0033B395DF